MKTKPSPADIIDLISRECRIPRDRLFSRTRVQYVVWPRHLCAYLLVTHCPHLGITGVAQYLKCDRGTIRNACRDVTDRISIYPDCAAQLRHLETLLPPLPMPRAVEHPRASEHSVPTVNQVNTVPVPHRRD